MLPVAHVQRLVDAIVEKGVVADSFFERRAAQQVGMEQKRPPRNRYPLAVVLLAAHLPRGHAEQRSLVVVVAAAAVIELHADVIAQEKCVDAVVVQTVADGRHLGIVDDTDQRMPCRTSEVAAVVIDASNLQDFAHRGKGLRSCLNKINNSRAYLPIGRRTIR